ncbi:phosphopantetheine-binding protein [Ruminiclostridium josui]|uniref:phosphopantetheine-binding protein n=1 Tax=Ruminiclostridium josui TaxID=1499 RepID=UPI001FA6ACC3|nr:phosphopantetheine-binding protein [Ruminiclostridium josui]
MQNVLDVWKEVLETENIGVYDNFFDVGGNSILLISMHEKLEEIYPKALSISDIFCKPFNCYAGRSYWKTPKQKWKTQ